MGTGRAHKAVPPEPAGMAVGRIRGRTKSSASPGYEIDRPWRVRSVMNGRTVLFCGDGYARPLVQAAHLAPDCRRLLQPSATPSPDVVVVAGGGSLGGSNWVNFRRSARRALPPASRS